MRLVRKDEGKESGFCSKKTSSFWKMYKEQVGTGRDFFLREIEIMATRNPTAHKKAVGSLNDNGVFWCITHYTQ